MLQIKNIIKKSAVYIVANIKRKTLEYWGIHVSLEMFTRNWDVL
jgi:hypothetical protein